MVRRVPFAGRLEDESGGQRSSLVRRVKSALVYAARSAARGTPSRTCGANTADAVATDSILYNFPGFLETNDESATLNN